MPSANAPMTSTEQQNAQRTFLHKTAVLYQNEADVWNMAKDWTDTPINSIGVKVPLELSPNPSLKIANLDGGTVGAPGARDLDNMVINYGTLMCASGVTYEALLNNNKETAEDQEMRRMESDVKQAVKFLNDFVSRGNGTHALADASAGYLGTDATTKRTFVANGSTDSIGPSQTVKGGWYEIYDATGVTKRSAAASPTDAIFRVESKTAANIVLASGSTLPTDYITGDILVPELGVTNAATGAIVGFPHIFDNAGTYFGKSRSAIPELQAFENALGGSLTASELMETYMGIKQRGGYGFGSAVELIDMLWLMVNITQEQNYYNLSLASGAVVGGIKTFQHNKDGAPNYDIGYADMNFTWFRAPLKVCNSTRGDEIYFANPKHLKKAVLKNFGEVGHGFNEQLLVNTTGIPILTKANYRDFVGQFFSPTPHRLGKISGITITGLQTQKVAMV